MIQRKYVFPVLFCFLLAGCAPVFFLGGAAAGIAGYKFYEGSLHVIYLAPYMETWDATLRALERMNLQIRSKEHDLTTGKIKAKRKDKKDVHITVKYESAEETEVVIRVGILGDESASDAIKEEIRKELFEG